MSSRSRSCSSASGCAPAACSTRAWRGPTRRVPSHRRGGAGRPGRRARAARRGPGGRRRGVFPDRASVERAVRRAVRDPHDGWAADLAAAAAGHRARPGARRVLARHDRAGPGRVPVHPLQRALRLADVAGQPRLLPGDPDRGRVADRRPAGRGADRPGRRRRPRPGPGRHPGGAAPPPAARRGTRRPRGRGMTTRLPFTLIPLDGEPFDLWLHAYAARLALSPGHLAEALGIPGRQDHQAAPANPSAAQLDAICAATGLAPPAVTAMLAAGPSPPIPLILAWTPQRATRFCPACLAGEPGQMPAAWSLPVTFFCLRHGRLLASRCPHCDRSPASRPLPSQAGHCGGTQGCGRRLDASSPPRYDSTPAASREQRAQEAISCFLADLRDPAGTADSRRHALGQLTDITLTAYHLAAENGPQHHAGHAFAPGMLDAGALTAAFTLLTARPGPSGQDPVASLVTGVPPGAVPPAIPSSWRPASPALAARITRARDPWLRPADRLRHATTLPLPCTPAPRPPGTADLAAARAARLPDQLWPDWAVRLTDDPASSSHEKLLPAALIALLLPHSGMPLNQVTAMVSGQLRRHITGYHMSKLTTEALRILTELAFAIDDHAIPIDYRRRRDLAASTTLIDDATWARMTREAGMRLAPTASARRYLYELLTGCGLDTAPPPFP